jgi:glycosyltransferase involved in cell wall biosynthesis
LLKNKPHIVLITTWFPPQKGVAVNRMYAFAKYLENFNYKVSVITITTGNEKDKEQTGTTNIYRLKNNAFLRYLNEIPGESRTLHSIKVIWNYFINKLGVKKYNAWHSHVIATLEQINIEEKIDIVISSFSPEETHLAAYKFCIKYPSVKWIADMRDEMSKNPHINASAQNKLAEIENMINQRCTAITAVSEPILNDFKNLLPRIKYFEEIRNGYDHSINRSDNFNDVFTICYAGTFYGDRKPDTFFNALFHFIKQTQTSIIIKFIGTHKNFNIPKELEKFCQFIPQVTNAQAIEIISKADANLLILPPVSGKGVYSGKIFDYLSVYKPIIAVVDKDDVAADLIRKLNAGYIADFNNTNEIVQAIQQAYVRWKEQKPFHVNTNSIELLHRQHQVKKLALLINIILEA